jgi:hypothetical protein
MPFEQGSISFRMLRPARSLSPETVARFAARAAPPLDASASGEIRGWVTGRHLLDREINERTAHFGGHLRLTLLSAERRVPPALLQAECRMEELAAQAAKDTPFLSRRERREIKQTVEERLRPQMPPQLTGIPFVYVASSNTMFAGAPSMKQSDVLCAFLLHTLDFHVVPCLPETLAEQRKGIDPSQWLPTSFSPDLPDESAECVPGREFLTWLWMASEARGGEFTLPGQGDLAVQIEGPLRFVREGNGAHETILRNGQPLLSAETKTCLLGGKLLRTARFLLVRGEERYAGTLEADEFVVRGLRLPDVEAADSMTRFQERIRALDDFRDMLWQLFDRFVDERSSPSSWRKTRVEIQRWVQDRKTRS